MVNAMGFDTFEELDESQWLQNIQDTMAQDKWPAECVRCEQTEKITRESIRTKSIERHNILQPLKKNYLVVGGVLDNVCNSACQTCNAGLSTKIGSLENKNYIKVDNINNFWDLPQDRILEVDVNGGEPTASRNYKKLLGNLPPKTKIVRMNTNGSRLIKELEDILKNKIMVIVTLSLDGVEETHDYVRWPIKWSNYIKSVMKYKNLQKQYPLLKLNTWTTVSSLNVADLPKILDFTSHHNLDHDWAFLDRPNVLNIKYENRFTKRAKVILQSSSHSQCRKIVDNVAVAGDNDADIMKFIQYQDNLRKIDYTDYML